MDKVTEYVQMARQEERLHRWRIAADLWRAAYRNDKHATTQVLSYYLDRIKDCESKYK